MYEFCTPIYLDTMKESGTWADAIAIQGMARMLGHDIHIVTSQEQSTKQGYLLNKVQARELPSDSHSKLPLLLEYVGEQHYISLGK